MIIDQLDAPLEGSLRPTLPGRVYTDPEQFAAEQAQIFEQTWFCAVASSDVARAGAAGPARGAGDAGPPAPRTGSSR